MPKKSSQKPKRSVKRRTITDNPTRARRWNWKPIFLRALAIEPNVTVACEMAVVTRSTVYEHREKNEEFAKQWDEAISEGCDRMESEAHRRAVNGVDKPVFQGGMMVGTVREYSDTLMSLLLKAHKPAKYRERSSVEMSGPEGGPAQVQIILPSNGRENLNGQSKSN